MAIHNEELDPKVQLQMGKIGSCVVQELTGDMRFLYHQQGFMI